ncbi:MAG: GspE/PulE family protein, partial [bacterium]
MHTVHFDKLAELLLDKGTVDKNTLIRATKTRSKEDPAKRRSLAQILVSDFNLDHDTVYGEVKNLYGFREITLNGEALDPSRVRFIRKMLALCPEPLQKEMKEELLLPFRYDAFRPEKLILLAADPTNRLIPLLVRALGVKRYEVCYIRIKELKFIFQQVFPQENEFLKNFDASEVELETDGDEESDIDEEAIEAEINKSMLVNLAEGMLVEAVREGASDIHIIPKDAKTTEIYTRVDGKLKLWHAQGGVRPEAISAVIKDRSKNIDRFERDKPQDGFIQRKIDGHNIRFRVSVMPIVGQHSQHKFESTVIRILDDRKVITDLGKLGLQGKVKEMFVKAITKPQGMIIVTGPTGSGKSTTLIAALHYVVKPEINVLTVEDPVEYIISGARQLKIGPKMNFEQALRSILRHDPDVVMVGEIRDKETAEIAIKLANTGHLTFSTLHTNDAPSAVSRLYKMGVETFLIASAINMIIAQRLIRKLCDFCKRPVRNLASRKALSLGFTEQEIANTTFYQAA